MRLKNSIKNSAAGLISCMFLFAGPFFVTPFLARLGEEILGIQKTFLDMVSLLSIVELGISFGIIYKLYKPISEKNFKKIAILLNFYKRAFKVIAGIVFILGLCTALFIVPAILAPKSSQSFSWLWLFCVFLCYVFDTIGTYLFGHKRAMLIADQKNYIVNICRTSSQLLMFILQILALYLFKSFLIYVIVKLFCTLLEAFLTNMQYNKRYKQIIDLNTKEKLEKAERKDLFKNLNALFYHKIGYQSLVSGSTIIMTNKLGEMVTGIYAPYALLTNGLTRVVEQIFSAILPSFGNLLVKGDTRRTYYIYNKIYFLNHLVFSFFTVSFFCMIEPFIAIWVGKGFTMPINSLVLITINFYMMGMRQTICMAKNSAGLYRPDRYFAILESIVNISFALILVDFIGINGIFAANLISTFLIPFWIQPYVVYANIFNRSVIEYYKKYFLYSVVTFISLISTWFLCSKLEYTGVLKLIFNATICLVLPNLINILVFFRTENFKYFWGVLKSILSKRFIRKIN